MAPSYLGGGYWLADANGQVFAFGDANYYGEPPFAPGGDRISGMAGSSDDSGYWLASANGNVACFGDAPPYGSPVGEGINGSVVGMATTFDGEGYWLQGSDGGVYSYGDAPSRRLHGRPAPQCGHRGHRLGQVTPANATLNRTALAGRTQPAVLSPTLSPATGWTARNGRGRRGHSGT